MASLLPHSKEGLYSADILDKLAYFFYSAHDGGMCLSWLEDESVPLSLAAGEE
jgi:hypothetical protein